METGGRCELTHRPGDPRCSVEVRFKSVDYKAVALKWYFGLRVRKQGLEPAIPKFTRVCSNKIASTWELATVNRRDGPQQSPARCNAGRH